MRLLCDSQCASEEANSKPILLVSLVDCLKDDDFGCSSFGVTPWVKEGDTLGELLCLELAAAVVWVKAAQGCSSPL